MGQAVTLIGDGIQNAANALVMKRAAAMFGAACCFRDTKGLVQAASGVLPNGETFVTIEADQIRGLHPRVVAFDNLPGAAEIYGYQAGPDFAVLVGNERRGLSYQCVKVATDKVQIPMLSRRINCLNVAAASAVALYYLRGTGVGPLAVRGEPHKRRPEVLLLCPGNHVEAGSAIRSAAAFGWRRVFIEDRQQVWFGCDRGVRSEGRAAARRGRNEILCIPCPAGASHAFTHATIITTKITATPVHRANLARGPNQLIVIPDETGADFALEDWSRLGKAVEFARLQIPVAQCICHYRLIATIALAEVSRQVGRRRAIKAPPPARQPIYDHRLARLAEVTGQIVRLDDLANY